MGDCTCTTIPASSANVQRAVNHWQHTEQRERAWAEQQLTKLAAATEPLDAPFPVPAYPPADWFTAKPDWLTPDTKIGVDDHGRVAGYFYHAGQCLVHDAAACPKPSPTRYAAFHQQDVAVESGDLIRCGVIGNTNGHADPYARVDVAQAHYADPSRQMLACCAYDDEHGGYILGAMVPHATYGDVALIRRSALSGDWRSMPDSWWAGNGIQGSVVRACEGYDCIGPTLVTRPGLPLVRSFGRAAALGGVGGVQLDEGAQRMSSTKIDLPNGITVTTDGPMVPPGPQPAMQAASPVPPSGDDGPGATSTPAEEAAEAPDIEAVEQRVSTLEDQVSQLQDVVGQLIDAVSAPMAASAALPRVSAPVAPLLAWYQGNANDTESDIAYHFATFDALVEQHGILHVIELGVREGHSTSAWCWLVGRRGGHVWSVDREIPPHLPPRPMWTLLIGDDLAPEISGALPGLVDALFIDTDHSYDHTTAELNLYGPRVRDGGVILLHDTANEHPEERGERIGAQEPFPVRRAMNDWAERHGHRTWEDEASWGLGVIYV